MNWFQKYILRLNPLEVRVRTMKLNPEDVIVLSTNNRVTVNTYEHIIQTFVNHGIKNKIILLDNLDMAVYQPK